MSGVGWVVVVVAVVIVIVVVVVVVVVVAVLVIVAVIIVVVVAVVVALARDSGARDPQEPGSHFFNFIFLVFYVLSNGASMNST